MDSQDVKMVESHHVKLSKFSMMMYGMGDLASQFVWTFVGTYLTVYYTDVVGLAPAAVSAIMLGARLFDGFNDPIMGMIAERTHSKWGRFRPYILFGAPFLAIFSVLTFTGPFGNGSLGVTWAAVTYVLAGVLYTLVNIPYGAMAAVMSTDEFERNSLNAFRSVGMNVGMIIVNSLSAGMLVYFSGGAKVATQSGYTTTAIIYAIISLPIFYGVFKTSKEVVKPIRNEKVPIQTTLKNVLGNKYLMILLAIMILQMTGFMGRIALVPYYVIYCLASFTLIALLMTIPSIGGALCSLFVVPLVKRFGKRVVLGATLVGQAFGLIVVYFSDFHNIPLIIAGHVIYGGLSIGFPITLTMVADSVDYQEWKTGVRTDGTAYATYGLATKIGNAVGASVGILILSAMGYKPNMQQTVSTQAGINLVVNLLPAILYIVAAAIVFFCWDLNEKRMDQIHFELEDKRKIRHQVDSATDENSRINNEVLQMPVSGQTIALDQVQDTVFASGALGQGIGIKPFSNHLFSPADGEITAVYPTGHVYTLRTTNGAEILIHIGINTVTLDGKGFVKMVHAGDKVQAGDQLGAFDRELIQSAGLDDTILILVTNMDNFQTIETLEIGDLDNGTELLKLKK